MTDAENTKPELPFLGSSGLVFSASVIVPYCAARAGRGEQRSSLFCFVIDVSGQHHPKTAIFQRNLFCLPFAFLLKAKSKEKKTANENQQARPTNSRSQS